MRMSKMLAAIVGLLMLAAAFSINWLCVCRMVKLVALCSGRKFSWRAATGTWLAAVLVREVLYQRKG